MYYGEPSPSIVDPNHHLLSRAGRFDYLRTVRPSDRQRARDFGARVQLTFVAYLAAFAVSMLVLGPLSDRYGRRSR